jgi:hypothetical protein
LLGAACLRSFRPIQIGYLPHAYSCLAGNGNCSQAGNWQLAKIRIARTSMAKLMEKVQLAPWRSSF